MHTYVRKVTRAIVVPGWTGGEDLRRGAGREHRRWRPPARAHLGPGGGVTTGDKKCLCDGAGRASVIGEWVR